MENNRYFLFLFEPRYNPLTMAYPYTQNIKNEIGQNIRHTREKKGLKQTDVAKEAGISAAHFIRIEEGKANPTLEKIYKIVKALRIKASQILPF